MFFGIILSILTGVVWGVIGVVNSQIARRKFDFITYGIQCCFLSTFGAAVFLMRWNNLLYESNDRVGELMVVFTLSGLFQALGFWFMQRAMRDGSHALAWTLGQAAFVVPFLCNVLLWHEPLILGRFAGLALIVAGIFAIGRVKADGKFPVFALLAFASIGISQALCTLPSHWPGWQDTANIRVPLLMGSTCLGYVFLRPVSSSSHQRGIWIFSFVGAVATLVGGFLFFKAIDHLATAQMVASAYPVTVGTCIVAFALYSKAFLAESQSILGMAITLAGLVFISF